jgi:predicted dehydrogenase
MRDNLNRVGTVRRYFSCYCQYSSRYDSFREGIVMNAFNPEMSNGAIMDIGIYTIYPMVVLFGAPQKVEASGVLLSSGADGQGAVNFQYEGMNATVLYSKIADSILPTEIQGEEGNLLLDRINIITAVDYIPRKTPGTERISAAADRDEYYYEIKEFIDLILDKRQESEINSWQNSLATMEIIDEIRRQLGIVYPADRV